MSAAPIDDNDKDALSQGLEAPAARGSFWIEKPLAAQTFADVSRTIRERAADEIERERKWQEYAEQCMILNRSW